MNSGQPRDISIASDFTNHDPLAPNRPSVPQQEFLAVDQRPDHVFPSGPPIASCTQMRFDRRELLGLGSRQIAVR